MGFWIFMLVMDLLIPVTMVFIGKRFQKKPPKEINAMYGYRTAMSMKNKETWKYGGALLFAQLYGFGQITQRDDRPQHPY